MTRLVTVEGQRVTNLVMATTSRNSATITTATGAGRSTVGRRDPAPFDVAMRPDAWRFLCLAPGRSPRDGPGGGTLRSVSFDRNRGFPSNINTCPLLEGDLLGGRRGGVPV